MQIDLNLSKDLFCPKLYPLLEDYSHRFEGYKGSAGSGKSYFITQKIILRCLKQNIKVLVCRRYGTTLRNTCFSLFKEVLQKWQLLPYVKIRETDFQISFPNGSIIIFTGLDEETKLLSLAGVNTIFVEEAVEVPYETFEQLNLRLRGGVDQQILFAFNPISKNHYLYDFCVEHPPQSFIFSETTYKDNKFLSKEYIQAIEELKFRNPAKFEIYGLGNWGVPIEGLVFTNWKEEEFDPLLLASSGLELRCGCDEGFTDPSCVVASLWDRKNKIIYVYDEFYKSGVQLDTIAQAIKDMKLTKTRLYCDSAAPRLIDFLRKQGVSAYPAIKGQGSVESRIAFLQNHQIIVHPKCTNVIRELSNFSYIKDKQTGNYTDNTTHEFSHSLDALGYAYSDIYTKGGFKAVNLGI